MKIRLNEIPEGGRDYDFNRQTAELNQVLTDLIQNRDYNVHVSIKPLNTKDFLMTGTLHTQVPEQCSRCAEDFDLSIDSKIREILIPNQEQDRTGKYAKSAGTKDADDENFSVTEYTHQQFDLGEFIHEAVALEIPFKPHCEVCSKPENDKTFIYDEKMSEDSKPNPFQALKGIKLN